MLIPYVATDIAVLARVSSHYPRVTVTTDVLREVRGLDADGCSALKIEILAPSDDQAMAIERAWRCAPQISPADASCLVTGRDLGMTCVTNDRALRAECRRQDIPVLWGLELMIELVRARMMSFDRASSVGRRIRELSPHHVTPRILKGFLDRIAAADPSRPTRRDSNHGILT